MKLPQWFMLLVPVVAGAELAPQAQHHVDSHAALPQAGTSFAQVGSTQSVKQPVSLQQNYPFSIIPFYRFLLFILTN